jgi:hypothetical protein
MKVLQSVCGVSTAAIALSISGAAQAASVSLTGTNTYNQEFNTHSISRRPISPPLARRTETR